MTLMAATACAVGALPTGAAQAAETAQTSSGNWSGYVVGESDSDSTSTFKSVTGSWVQPKATCNASEGATYAAFWVGLGGASGKTALEQDGTEVNCSADGKATYYAWYELVPKAPVKVDLAVRPGDKMTATTTVDGHQVTETITNQTTGDTFSKTLYMSSPDTSSAEWIAEAPSECQGSVSNCTTLPLTNFGKVTFTSATATDSTGHTGTISDADWQTEAVTLDSGVTTSGPQFVGESISTGTGTATPTALTSAGSSFAVTYKRGASNASSGYGSTSGYGYGSTSGDGYAYGAGGGYGYGSTSGYGYGSTSGYGSGYGSDPYGDSSATGGYGSSSYGDGYGDSSGATGYYGQGQSGGYILVYTY